MTKPPSEPWPWIWIAAGITVAWVAWRTNRILRDAPTLPVATALGRAVGLEAIGARVAG